MVADAACFRAGYRGGRLWHMKLGLANPGPVGCVDRREALKCISVKIVYGMLLCEDR